MSEPAAWLECSFGFVIILLCVIFLYLYGKEFAHMKIVLVEDNQALNRLITYKLNQAGYDATGYTMAAEMIENYPEIQPDLLLIDYSLPDMTGEELVEVLREMNYDAPFIIITGHSDIQLAISLMKMGALDYVVKNEGFQDILPALVEKAYDQIKMMRKVEEAREQIKKNEVLYRNTVDKIPDPIFYYSGEEVLFINEAFRQKLKYSFEEMNGPAFREIVPDKYFNKVEAWFDEHKPGQTFPVFEIELQSKDKKNLYFLVKAIKTRFKNKTAIMVVLSDITEKKAFEARLMKSILDTEEKERMRFARDLHDELGPILSGIKMYTGLLGKSGEQENQDEVVGKITELVDDAVQASRNLSRDMIPGILIDFGLNHAIRSFVDQISGDSGLDINFDSTLKSRLEQNIEISLFRIVKELINNSLKHADASSIDIQIFETKGRKVSLFYEDDGCGFDLEMLKKDLSVSGIGLRNIVNRLDMINARYKFETEPGQGFAFTTTVFLDNQLGTEI